MKVGREWRAGQAWVDVKTLLAQPDSKVELTALWSCAKMRKVRGNGKGRMGLGGGQLQATQRQQLGVLQTRCSFPYV